MEDVPNAKIAKHFRLTMALSASTYWMKIPPKNPAGVWASNGSL